jgi:hypothetical protein
LRQQVDTMAEEITALRDERDELKVRDLGGSIDLQPFEVELADPLFFCCSFRAKNYSQIGVFLR